MAKRQLQSYGIMVVGQRVEFSRLDNALKDEPETIRSEHTITEILECETGVLVTLKGAAVTIVKAFDSYGRSWGGFGDLRVLQDPPEQLVIGAVKGIDYGNRISSKHSLNVQNDPP